MRALIHGCVLIALAWSLPGTAQETGATVPWWQQQKIRFMWGQWNHARIDPDGDWWSADLPRELFRDLASAGGTVFVECRWFKPDHARYAHEFGLKYFATLFVCDLSGKVGERKWLKADEQHWWPCPLDQAAYERWIVEPNLAGIEQGLIDGLHFDWEAYGGKGEAGICYCDACFAEFLARRNRAMELPASLERRAWLERNQLAEEYEQDFSRQRIAMFTRIRKKLQAPNPRLLFSSYNMLVSDFSKGVHTAEAPFIVADNRHYYNDNRQAWWESYGPWLRRQGYLYIPGGWTNALFGAQASDVSAARWIYEAAINEDGCWLWFERELDDEILRAYASADREIRGVVAKMGRFLFQGKPTRNFVSVTEWTGRPELATAIVPRTYSLDAAHLVHLSNVNTEWPVRVRVRLPRLTPDARWTVRDGRNDLTYTDSDGSPVWTSAALTSGVVVTLEPRTDLFLVVEAAAADPPAPAAARLIHSRTFDRLPDHDAAAAGPVKILVRLYSRKNAVYEEALETLLRTTEPVLDLPKNGWFFRMDKDDVGAGEGWFRPDTPLDDWVPIETETFWGSKGGVGAGWYRRDLEVPELPADSRVYLHFGAVDERMVLWIDGEYVGDYDREPEKGWDQPFAIDVTAALTPGVHHLAARVQNVSAAGGIWKPVRILVAPEAADVPAGAQETAAAAAPAGQLVYTATEPMGFAGPEGGLTIGNAIRTMAADGSAHRRVRQVRGHLWAPVYSPNGDRIAFVHDAGGRGQIFVMNADGSGLVNISKNAFCDRDPVWAPDGNRIAFRSDRNGDWDIWTMNADGAGQRRLAGNPGLDQAPAWAPDGTRLAWESHVSILPAIWVCGADGSAPHPLITPGEPMTIKAAIKREVVDVQPFVPGNEFALTRPVWAPDGTRIAGVGLSREHMVFVVDVDGARMLQVIPWIPFVGDLCWSPDGTLLAGAWRTAPQETERSGIFVIRADGTDPNRFGTWLVDVTPQGPRMGGARRHGVMSWYSHGSAQPRRVVKTFTSLAWAPDGNTLAFSSDMDPSGAFHVYTVPASGGTPRKLEATASAWPQQVAWRPR